MSDPVGAVSMTLEDEPRVDTTPAPAKLEEVILQGDSVPEMLRGKSAAEAVAMMKGMSEALKLSEQARQQAELTAATALKTQPAPVAPEPEPQEMSDQELAELHAENPLAAIRVMNDQAIRRAERNLESRLKPLFNGSAVSAEQQARAKYADEFALFGDQITQMATQIPNSQVVLTNPAAWDDLISLVRGRSGNIERLIEKRTATNVEATRRQAQETQIDTVGFSGTEPRARPTARTVAQLDPIQREIAEKMGLTPDEYVKWSQV